MELVTKEFSYNDNRVTFRTEDGRRYVNLTEMFKAFPQKELRNWKNSKRTKDLKSALEANQSDIVNYDIIDNQRVMFSTKGNVSGGVDQGTWAIQTLALDAAMYLSPSFHLWVMEKIEELLENGIVSTNNQKLLELAPKVEAYENLLNAENSETVETAAKNIGIGRNQLYKFLRDNKFLQTNHMPYQKYMNLGWFQVRTSIVTRRDGTKMQKSKTTVTGKGKDAIRRVLLDHGYELAKVTDTLNSLDEQINLKHSKEIRQLNRKIKSLEEKAGITDKFLSCRIASITPSLMLGERKDGLIRRAETNLGKILGSVSVAFFDNSIVKVSKRVGPKRYNELCTLSKIKPQESRDSYTFRYDFDNHELAVECIKKY